MRGFDSLPEMKNCDNVCSPQRFSPRFIWAVSGVVGAWLLLSGCQKQQPVALLEQKCGTCHPADVVYRSRYDKVGWEKVIHGMKQRGLTLTAREEEEVKAILLRDYSTE